MHGRKRPTTKRVPTEAEIAKEKAKVAKYSQLVSSALELRRTATMDAKAWELTSVLLKLNPDFYSMWNFRRDILVKSCYRE